MIVSFIGGEIGVDLLLLGAALLREVGGLTLCIVAIRATILNGPLLWGLFTVRGTKLLWCAYLTLCVVAEMQGVPSTCMVVS